MANTMTLDDKGQKVVWSGAVTDVHTTQKEVIGSTRFHGMKVYRYYKFDNGSGSVAAVSGNIAVFKATTQDTVTSDVSDGDTNKVAAGMFVSAPADGQFCWLQVRGPATVNQAINSGADGAGCIPHSTDGMLTVATANDLIAPCATASDASEKMVWLHCVMQEIMGDLSLLQMRNQVKLALGNRDDLDEHLDSLINTCQMRIARFFDFEEMLSLVDLSIGYTGVALADSSVSLPTKTRDVYGVTIVDGSDYYTVNAVDRPTWKNTFFVDIPTAGKDRPAHYCIFSSTIELYPPPDKAYTAKLRRSKWPADLTDDDSLSELDTKDDLLIALSICWTLYHLNNVERGNAYWAMFRSMLKEAMGSQNVKPDLYQKIDALRPSANTSYWKDPFVRSVTHG